VSLGPRPVFAIPSRGRAEHAAALVRQLSQTHPDCPILVAHDGDEEDFRGYARLLPRERLWSRQERTQWATALAVKARLPLSWVLAGLAPSQYPSDGQITTGAVRNALLLRAAPAHLWMLDDDIVLPALSTSDSCCWGMAQRVRMASLDITLHRSPTDARQGLNTPVDLVALAQQWLGHYFELPLGLQGSTRQGRVNALSLGHFGAPASPNQGWRLGADLHAGPVAPVDLSPDVRVTVRVPTIAWGGAHVAMASAYDTAVPLPPFPPQGRNQDGIFGILMSALFADSARAWLPACVEHDRPQRWPIGLKPAPRSLPERLALWTLEFARRDGNLPALAQRLRTATQTADEGDWTNLLAIWPVLQDTAPSVELPWGKHAALESPTLCCAGRNPG
jgi:hypothetical protein